MDSAPSHSLIGMLETLNAPRRGPDIPIPHKPRTIHRSDDGEDRQWHEQRVRQVDCSIRDMTLAVIKEAGDYIRSGDIIERVQESLLQAGRKAPHESSIREHITRLVDSGDVVTVGPQNKRRYRA